MPRMSMKKHVIIYHSLQSMEVYSNFKKMCKIKELPYHSLKGKKFPIEGNKYFIYKVRII
jgi:hypothetical protein